MVSVAAKPTEYTQVTVLFADVVRSTGVAGAVGAEGLREIMLELFDRATALVQRRYGGTVDKPAGEGSWRCRGIHCLRRSSDPSVFGSLGIQAVVAHGG